MNLQELINATLAIMAQFGIPASVLQSDEGGAMIIQTLLRLQEADRRHREICELLELIRQALHKK